jgi:ABC-2 type transport system permease protein
MWQQIRAIAWAQFRTTRNHLPRTNAGTVLLGLISLLWYGMYLGLGVFLASILPHLDRAQLRQWVPVGLFAVFLFWQVIPLITLSGGWSLQLKKLQIYPVSTSALFGIEAFLRLTTAPEMILVLACALIGLLRNPYIHFPFPFFLFLFFPINLFLSLAIREWILHSFERNRFREVFAVLIISISVVPQLILRTTLGHRLLPYFLAVGHGRATPWSEVGNLSIGAFNTLDLALVFFWTAACYWFARRQFEKGLRQDEGFRTSLSVTVRAEENGFARKLLDLPSRLFRDPLAALLQKELQSLIRMPRFRVMFGMACVFSILIFVPMALNAAANGGNGFMRNNFLPVVTLYGLLLLSDVLLFNAFGFDRAAAQIYFVAPIPFETVLKAKNLTAVAFIALQSGTVLILAAFVRSAITPLNIANAVASAVVVGTFFLCAGNFTSVAFARPVDPTQTFRKQAGGKMQFWFLLCSAGMFMLIGFAFLARYALQSNWALLGVLVVEFLIGLIVYRISAQSAVERGLRDREQFLEVLSRGSSPIGLGLS